MQWTAGANAGFTTGTPWRAVNSNYVDYNVATELQDSGSLLRWYQELIAVRNESPALRRGVHVPLGTSDSPVLAFVRSDEQQTVLCLANTSSSAFGSVNLTGSSQSLAPGEHTLVNLLDPGDTLSVTVNADYEVGGFHLSGYQVAVYEFADTTGTDDGDEGEGSSLRLEQSYPNPFTPSTTIQYSLPFRMHVRLGIYDVAGREVAVLEDGTQSGGPHETGWSGVDGEGNPVAAGMYFVRLEAGDETRTSKVMLVK